jgi:hypothetical protein
MVVENPRTAKIRKIPWREGLCVLIAKSFLRMKTSWLGEWTGLTGNSLAITMHIFDPLGRFFIKPPGKGLLCRAAAVQIEIL